jgi:hypothetical protein
MKLLLFILFIAVTVAEDTRECFTQEWALGLVPCFVEPFLPFLDLIPTSVSSSGPGRTLQSLGGHHKQDKSPIDRPAKMNKWYKLMHGMAEVHDDYQQALLDAMGGRRPHTKEQKEKENIAKKLLKIDLNIVKEEYVSALLDLHFQVEERLEQFSSLHLYKAESQQSEEATPHKEADLHILDLCNQADSLLPDVDLSELCIFADRAWTCLQNYTETDMEDNLKWVQCFYQCSDMGPMSQCIGEQFEGCGLGWPLKDLSWLGDVISRVIIEYLDFDKCMLNVISPSEIRVEEGGEAEMVEFQVYLPPSVMCIDIGFTSTPVGMVTALVKWITGDTFTCNPRVTLTTSNYVNNLLSKRIPGIPVLGTIQLGRPSCRNNKMIKQAVIGWHENAINESGIIHITESNWNQTFMVPVRASIDGKLDGDVTDASFTLKLKAGFITQQTIKIPLSMIDRDVLRVDLQRKAVSTCSVINDPHIVSFDQFYYNNYYDGHFTVYKHNNFSYEVEAVFQSCGADINASCTCGVSVRMGDDVFVVDRCRRKTDDCVNGDCEPGMKVTLHKNGELTPGTRIFRKLDGLQYEVLLPHGTYITIMVNGLFLNFWIRPSANDRDQSSGLCGVYNGNPLDDLTLPDGTIYTGDGSAVGEQPRPFNKAWRVPEEDSLFWGVEAGSGLDMLDVNKYCTCVHTVILGTTCECGYDKLVEDCDIDTSGELDSEELPMITQTSMAQLDADSSIQTDDDLDIDVDYEPPEHVWTNQAEKNAAETKCLDMMKEDVLLEACRRELFTVIFGNPSIATIYALDLKGCVDDILVTGNPDWATSALQSAKQRCKGMLYLAINKNQAAVDDVLVLSCINECSYQGECINGSCVCYSNVTGADCSIPKSAVPFMSNAEPSVCNIRNEN